MARRHKNQERPVARKAGHRKVDDTMSGDEGIDQSMAVSSGRDEEMEPSEFEGQGGQKEGARGREQGTGYTRDRSGQLQDDDSLSGSQGRHGKSGSRQGSGTSDSERVGGQTAQNPRERKIDRTRM
ncbi:MAG TPA: hypothetical protein VK864_08230 [Longimicrobiales bacterium]|nr:hypothetical protein [Longimicrobiales bacterium]